MPIDWFTVAAQAINFLLLVWLMKRFLYKPVLRAIDAREKRIEEQLNDAKAQKMEARKEKEEFQRKNEIFDRERTELMNAAAEKAKGETIHLLEEARSSAETLRAKWREGLEKDASRLEEDFQKRVRKDVFSIVRKTLSDLAGEELESKIIDLFLRRLGKMDEKERKNLVPTTKVPDASVLLRTAFPLTEEQRSTIGQEVKKLFFLKEEPKFTVEKNLVAGMELAVSGQKISWTIDDYLLSLRDSVEDLMKPGKKASSSPNDEEQEDAPLEGPSQSDRNPPEKRQKSDPPGEEEKEKQ
ncbi:ATP synthase F0 subcomplex B subunit [Aminivibrio pyruvatiphilus]|uniref:ATP synthase subunit b n=1 Tax=Aminivibrio pyruvatiphilus TaxID=1005740 RepID=A0A4R8MH41_9BACT|nr:F0F1 ATP synthase subunit B [Aminivibrio pyruvatiphilus]TDY63255.1 ATP synthase F0 subcomplex B subunit [Aminivibrio pyruvatiphilus]